MKIEFLKRQIDTWNVPIAWGKIQDGRMVVDCPHGNHQHIHGSAEGHRVGHCGEDYIIVNEEKRAQLI
tara:strand:+ start:225 stop:428 length:204 start_codon:yes stop_codon:yes gene_type:complete